MRFKLWLEDDRLSLIDQLIKAVKEIYDGPPHPNVLKRWQTDTLEELKQHLKFLETERPKAEFNKRLKQREQEKQAVALHTSYDSYERLEPGDVFERIICGGLQGNMPMFKLEQLNDPVLHKYYGIYVGSADDWLDWMVDDGYCDGDIYIYDITIPPKPAFYLTRDPASGGWAGEDASKEVPDAQIIFSTTSSIPAKYIKLDKVIKEKEYWKERKQREREF